MPSFSTRIYLFVYSFFLSRSQTATKCGPRPHSPLVFICLFIRTFFLGLRRQRSVVLVLLLHSYLFVYLFLPSLSQTATKCGPRPPSPLVFIYLFIHSFFLSLSDSSEMWSSSSFSTRIYLFIPSFFFCLRRQRNVVLVLLLHSYLFIPSFSLSDGNEDKAFTVQPNHGSILLAQPVDCETRSSYNLTLSVTDGVHKDFTWVSRLIIQSATLCYSGHGHTGCMPVCVVLGL